MMNNFELFGRHAFRKSLCQPEGSRSVLNIALFDVCSTILSNFDRDEILRAGDKIRVALQELIANDVFAHAVTYATNGTTQVRARFQMAELGIRKAMNCVFPWAESPF